MYIEGLMNSTSKKILSIYGWYGTAAILVAYFLVSFGLAGDLVIYQILNLTGSTALAIIGFMKKAWQPAVLEAAWAFIAIGSLFWLLMK